MHATLAAMDVRRVGRVIRTLRRHRGWRQGDLAARAGVSQATVSDLELGRIERATAHTLDVVLGALDARLIVDVRWRGGALDRLLDERHAALSGATAQALEKLGWKVAVEVSFSHFGERGSIDILAWHPQTAILLVVEVKTELNSIEETLRRLDVKTRLASGIARERLGWNARSVCRLLVLPDESTARRRVAGQAAILERALPLRGRDLRRWLLRPSGQASGLLFLSPTPGGSTRRVPVNRQRVRVGTPRTPGSDERL